MLQVLPSETQGGCRGGDCSEHFLVHDPHLDTHLLVEDTSLIASMRRVNVISETLGGADLLQRVPFALWGFSYLCSFWKQVWKRLYEDSVCVV